MMDLKENRRSFRVQEKVYLKYEVINEEQFGLGLEHYKLQAGANDSAQAMLVDMEARLSEALFLLNAENPKVTKCLTLLNDKLNVVVEQLPTLRKTKASLAETTPQHCDVGADGMMFSSSERLDMGTRLHLQCLLSSDNRYVETFGHVVRISDPLDTGNPEHRYGIGVEFDDMSRAQREILIQYMFSRESESLRIRRLEIDEPTD